MNEHRWMIVTNQYLGYQNARKYNDTLLQLETQNPQALSLRRLIDDKVKSGACKPPDAISCM